MVDNDDEEIESGKDRSEVSCPTGCCERMATSTHTSLSPITRKSLKELVLSVQQPFPPSHLLLSPQIGSEG